LCSSILKKSKHIFGIQSELFDGDIQSELFDGDIQSELFDGDIQCKRLIDTVYLPLTGWYTAAQELQQIFWYLDCLHMPDKRLIDTVYLPLTGWYTAAQELQQIFWYLDCLHMPDCLATSWAHVWPFETTPGWSPNGQPSASITCVLRKKKNNIHLYKKTYILLNTHTHNTHTHNTHTYTHTQHTHLHTHTQHTHLHTHTTHTLTHTHTQTHTAYSLVTAGALAS
jgi:hypothetical protein